MATRMRLALLLRRQMGAASSIRSTTIHSHPSPALLLRQMGAAVPAFSIHSTTIRSDSRGPTHPAFSAIPARCLTGGPTPGGCRMCRACREFGYATSTKFVRACREFGHATSEVLRKAMELLKWLLDEFCILARKALDEILTSIYQWMKARINDQLAGMVVLCITGLLCYICKGTPFENFFEMEAEEHFGLKASEFLQQSSELISRTAQYDQRITMVEDRLVKLEADINKVSEGIAAMQQLEARINKMSEAIAAMQQLEARINKMSEAIAAMKEKRP